MSRRAGDLDWTDDLDVLPVVLSDDDHDVFRAVLANPPPAPPRLTALMRSVHAWERPRRALPRREGTFAGRLCRS